MIHGDECPKAEINVEKGEEQIWDEREYLAHIISEFPRNSNILSPFRYRIKLYNSKKKNSVYLKDLRIIHQGGFFFSLFYVLISPDHSTHLLLLETARIKNITLSGPCFPLTELLQMQWDSVQS